MASFDDVRRFALQLPLAYEEAHFEGPAFRVRNRKFALLWLPTGQTIMKLPQAHQEALFAARPDTFMPTRVGTVDWCIVRLERLETAELEELVVAAWSTLVSKKLVRAHTAGERQRPPQQDCSPLL